MKKLVLLSVLLLISSFLYAQSTNGSITGRVTDPGKAVLPGAKILLINTDTNVNRTVKTDSVGSYHIASVQPGNYRLEVEHQGFRTVIKPAIAVHVQDALEINFEMAVGAASETVTVSGGAPMVNTTDGSISTVVDQSYIANMPLNGRSFQDLILLTPGTVTQTPQNSGNAVLGVSGEFSVNGQRAESNNYTVNGVSANVGAAAGGIMLNGAGPSGSIPGATALGTTQALVSVDELQEFRVQSSTYSAEYGRNPGGQFAFETKSGTNQWHGTAYDYLRNDMFDANDWFNNYFAKKKAPLRQNDFGGTLGGPLVIPHVYDGKDKTFFFFSYEGLRLLQPQAATPYNVPTSATRNSAPAVLQPALNAFPVQNGADVQIACNPVTDPTCPPSGQKLSGLGEFIDTWSNPGTINATAIRFDHAIKDNLRLFFRFSDARSSSATRGGFYTPSTVDTLGSTVRTYTVGAIAMFTPRVSNEFRLNYSSSVTTDDTSIDAFGGGTPVDLVQLSGAPAGSTARITLDFGGGALAGFLNQGQTSGTQRQWNLVDTMSWSLGRHQLKFGVDYRRLTPIAIQAPVFANFGYNDATAIQNNNANISLDALSPAYPLYTNFSAFAEDEWRISQRLSVSMGLRWDVNPAPGVTRGLNAYTIAGASNPDPNTWSLAPQGTPLWSTTWGNLAPRIGAAYAIRNAQGWETVARGGFGVFFDTGQQLASLGFLQGPGFFAFSPAPGSSFPISGAAIPVVTPPVDPGFLFGFAPDLKLPYTLQWNGTVEQGLGKSQALTVSYVGSHASRLLEENTFLPTANPNGVFVATRVQNGLTSDYDALEAQFRRRLSKGLTVLASYTWSHCLDYGSQNYSIGYQRGNCDFDVRNSLSAAASYDLPNLGHSGWANALVHHWGVDNRLTARSGFPVGLAGFGLTQPNGQIFDEGVNLVPGQPVYLHGDNCAAVLQGLGELQPGQRCPGGRAINPNAFVDSASGVGNAPRNFARGFGAWQLDMAVRRDFPITERLRLQFRVEAFNLFNTPNYGSISSQVTAPHFGLATASLANSLGTTLSPLYQMGGARSMQFALKLTF